MYKQARSARRTLPKLSGGMFPQVTDGPPVPALSRQELGHSLANVSVLSSHDPSSLQAKMTVNTPGDSHEQEADSVASRIIGTESNENFHLKNGGSGELARSEKSDSSAVDSDISDTVQKGVSGGGQPLDSETRSFMEPRFGHDFSNVRIHTDTSAAASASSVSARAYAVGSDIVFDRGEYNPGNSSGKQLLAHELTHVIQQGGSVSRNGESDVAQRAVNISNSRNTGEIIQRTPHPYHPSNAAYSQPELDPEPVLAQCRAAAGNYTGIISDDPLWPHVPDLAGRVRNAFMGNYFTSRGDFSDNQTYDPGFMYPNYKVTVNITLYEDQVGNANPGNTATVGSQATSGTGSQTSASTQQTASGSASASGGEKDKYNVGGSGSGGTQSTTGNQTTQSGGGQTSGSMQSGTEVKTSNIIAHVEVIVDQFDRISSYHTTGEGQIISIPVGTVKYTEATQGAPGPSAATGTPPQ